MEIPVHEVFTRDTSVFVIDQVPAVALIVVRLALLTSAIYGGVLYLFGKRKSKMTDPSPNCAALLIR